MSPDSTTVAQGFERVEKAFVEGASDLGDGGGAFSVYVDGELVVDLWAGSRRPGVPWEHDTLATLMSTTKGLTALCAQVLWSRGLLDVDAPVAEYWPEFGCNGKERATVRQVLDHTVGVLGLPHPERVLDWQGGGWADYDAIAAQLAAATPAWEPGSRIGYHAISCGWLTGELVRRITGRTIGDFFRTEVALPLGLDAWIGTPPSEQDRVADVVGESREGVPPELLELDDTLRAGFADPASPLGVAAIAMHGGSIIGNLPSFMNLPAVRGLEIAAANGTAGARDIARLYAMLACGGSLDGVRVVSEESVRLFSTVSAQGRSAITPAVTLPGGLEIPPPLTTYGLGYARNVPEPGMPPAFGPHEETFGHAGHGGQVGFADPVRRLGVGFVRSHLAYLPTFAATLIATLYECLD
jgi:CubicO group peptidase (beta-lactamase class C family)